MEEPYKHTLTATDRAIFDKWLLGVAGFYASLVLLVICAIGLSHLADNPAQHATAQVVPRSSSSPP
jgi:hypothetical protein